MRATVIALLARGAAVVVGVARHADVAVAAAVGTGVGVAHADAGEAALPRDAGRFGATATDASRRAVVGQGRVAGDTGRASVAAPADRSGLAEVVRAAAVRAGGCVADAVVRDAVLAGHTLCQAAAGTDAIDTIVSTDGVAREARFTRDAAGVDRARLATCARAATVGAGILVATLAAVGDALLDAWAAYTRSATGSAGGIRRSRQAGVARAAARAGGGVAHTGAADAGLAGSAYGTATALARAGRLVAGVGSGRVARDTCRAANAAGVDIWCFTDVAVAAAIGARRGVADTAPADAPRTGSAGWAGAAEALTRGRAGVCGGRVTGHADIAADTALRYRPRAADVAVAAAVGAGRGRALAQTVHALLPHGAGRPAAAFALTRGRAGVGAQRVADDA